MSRHTWGEPTPVTVEAPRCSTCGLIDYDGKHAFDECPGEALLCANCKTSLDEDHYCTICGQVARPEAE
jgi:hypothetical protein